MPPDETRLRALEDGFYGTWRGGTNFCDGVGRSVDEREREVADALMNPGAFIDPAELQSDFLDTFVTAPPPFDDPRTEKEATTLDVEQPGDGSESRP